MKKIISLILVSLVLTMCASKEDRQRKIVENYIETILKTDDEKMHEIFSLLKITNPIPEEEKEDMVMLFKSIKERLKGKKYKVINFQETAEYLKKTKLGEPLNSDRGTIFYIYSIDEELVLWPTATVVDEQYNIVCMGVHFCNNPKRLCLMCF